MEVYLFYAASRCWARSSFQSQSYPIIKGKLFFGLRNRFWNNHSRQHFPTLQPYLATAPGEKCSWANTQAKLRFKAAPGKYRPTGKWNGQWGLAKQRENRLLRPNLYRDLTVSRTKLLHLTRRLDGTKAQQGEVESVFTSLTLGAPTQSKWTHSVSQMSNF